MGLQVALVDHRHPVRVLEHEVGLGEALGHVPPVEVGLLGHVDGLGRLGLALGRRHPGVRQRLARVGLGPRVRHRRRPGLHRPQGVDRDRQHLVHHLDQVERLLRDRQLVRRHGGHGLAGEDRAVDGEHRVRPGRRLALELGDVGRRQDGPHAGQRPGAARVDPDDAGVRVGTSQELRVKEPAGLEIGHVLDLARHLLRPVRPRNGEPDPLHFARGLHRHGSSSSPYVRVAWAASSIAASIFV